MSYIAWQGGNPPSDGPLTAEFGNSGSISNTGFLYQNGMEEFMASKLSGTTVTFSHIWTPLIPGTPDPADPVYSPNGDYYFATNVSGSYVVSAVIDGVPAQNKLVFSITSRGAGLYGSGTWGQGATDGTSPPAKTIGWGAGNPPGTTGFAVANAGTSGDFSDTASGGVVEPFGSVVYVHTWTPAIAGKPSAVNAFTVVSNRFSVYLNGVRDAGTVKVTAVINGRAAGTFCVLKVAVRNPATFTYTPFTWASEIPVVILFWTLLLGTLET